LALVGLTLAGLLAACQIGFNPPAVYHGGESRNSLPAIDPHAAPLIGSPDARWVVDLFFDYECPHCQKAHSMLDDAIARYHGTLAFALCPAPLNSRCNPYVPQDVDEFKDSCELAKLGLAVWVAHHEAFSDFDRWMFSAEPGEPWRPRTLDAAGAKAVELVGQAPFDAARADPWIERFMQTSIQIYGQSILHEQSSNAVPKLVFGRRWVTPQPNDVDDLVSILHDGLFVPGP
jgi:thiol-disulfide isomerase/thioredoxin